MMRHKPGHRTTITWRAHGQSLVELSAGLIVAIPVLLALLDCAVIAIGAGAHDMACRDAARAAASGPPAVMSAGIRIVSNSQEPKMRAKQVVARIYHLGIPVKVRDDQLEVREDLKNPMPTSPIGGSINGTVSVSSTVDIFPPWVIGSVAPKVTLKSRHSYPYTYVMPTTVASGD